MDRDILESDWKMFRNVRELALERFCERVLKEVERINADTRKSQHQRYGEIWRVLKERDRELADAFNAPRRSVALMQLMLIRSHDLLTDEEFAQFSDQTRGAVERFLEVRQG